jgi:hypothetical protein
MKDQSILIGLVDRAHVLMTGHAAPGWQLCRRTTVIGPDHNGAVGRDIGSSLRCQFDEHTRAPGAAQVEH